MSGAREEANRRWPRGWDVEEGTWRDGAVNGFILGAEWAIHPVDSQNVYDLAWQALTGRDDPWGGCAERETVLRIANLLLDFPAYSA